MDRNNPYAIGAELDRRLGEVLVSAPKVSAYQLVLRRRWLVARFAIATGALFALIALLLSPQYESVARLMPPDHNESMLLAALAGRAGEGLGLDASSLLGMRSSGALFVGILSSNAVEDEVIAKFNLQKEYKKRFLETTRKELARRTDIAEDRKDGIITLKCLDSNPQRAREMCQAYIDDLNQLMVKVSTGSARREREFLEQRLKGVKADLDAASVAFSKFASRNTAIDLPQQGKAMVESAAIVQGQLIAAQAELRGLREVYGPEHVRVRAVEARIAELRTQMDKIGGTDAQLESPTGDTMYPPIRKLPLLAVTYTDLYRNAKIQEAVYETLTKQYEMAKVQEVKETPSVKVLDVPTLPERKASPHRTVITICGLLLGIAIGVGWIVGRSSWEHTDKSHPKKAAALETWQALHDDWFRLARAFRRAPSP
jgi:uncharacterized protein involved in exopolysaccharide biosynthesis